MLDVMKIRKDFPMLMRHPKLVYLDNGATALKPQCVIDAVVSYYEDMTSNVHRGDYDLAYTVSKAYDETREVVARLIHASRPQEIVFTSGASGALNLAAAGQAFRLHPGDIILTSEVEHASSILPWFRIARQTGAEIRYVPLDEKGRMSPEGFASAINERVKVVALAHVSNVLGYEIPIEAVTRLAHQVGAIVVIDAAQSIAHLPIDVQRWDIDFLAFSAHKICGPSGVGVLYGKYDLLQEMESVNLGGGSNARFDSCGNLLLKEAPLKFEAGTPAIEATLGMKAALNYVMDLGLENIRLYEEELKRYCVEKMSQLEHVILYNADSSAPIVAFNIQGVFAQDGATYLNTKNIAVRAGNHCAKILMEVLKTSETLRASFSFYTTKEEIDRFVQAVSEISLENCIDIFI